MRINNGISRLGLSVTASLLAVGAIAAGNTQDVSVTSTPVGADVVIDGQALGHTPGTAALSIDRKHTVVVSKAGYASQTIDVTPASGKLVPPAINVELDAASEAAVPAAPAQAAAVAPAAIGTSTTGLSASEQAEAVATAPISPVPPPGALNQDHPSSTLRKNPTAQLLLGSFAVHLGSTTLLDVRNAVGAGQMLQQGHNGKYRAWLCYTIPQGTNGALNPERVWLVASELNGGVHVDSVDAVRLSAEFGASAACPELPAHLANVRFENGLWLGSTKADLLRNLGAPGATEDDGWSYSYADEQPNYVVKNLLQTQIESGRVTALHAGRELVT